MDAKTHPPGRSGLSTASSSSSTAASTVRADTPAARPGTERTLTPVKTKPVIRHVSLDEVRAEVARFEAAHPGIGADNYPDAFRDADGELIETEEFFAACRMYSILAANGE